MCWRWCIGLVSLYTNGFFYRICQTRKNTFKDYKAKNPAGGIKLKYLINARQDIKNVVDTEIVPLLNF